MQMLDALDTVRLRPVNTTDRVFLEALYAETRADELLHFPWNEAEKSNFLKQQFDAQDRTYRSCYPEANFDVVEYQAQPIGRLYVHRGQDAIRVIDISLLSSWRGLGIGTWLLSALIDESESSVLPIILHVDPSNPAMRLYQRLRFEQGQLEGMYLCMMRAPGLLQTLRLSERPLEHLEGTLL